MKNTGTDPRASEPKMHMPGWRDAEIKSADRPQAITDGNDDTSCATRSECDEQLRRQALTYHMRPRPGKIETVPTKPFATPHDLSLAYSPGVAYASTAIRDDAARVYDITDKGNLVAVISNGTAVLGLGNIGALAAKPVMEGKALLFKVFADIDCFDIELSATDVDGFVNAVMAMAPTFGGINLEDIKAPECFEIERRLREKLDIPVMHDDQHGTAIITAAGMLNALYLQHKDITQIRLVVNGAGAAAMACTDMLVALGVNKHNIVMVDSKGVIRTNRRDLSDAKRRYATSRPIDTLEEAMVRADVFLGLSVADVVTPEMLLSMAPRPIVFALANPDPEIAYDKAMSTRSDLIFATGRSDLPNQINNVLGFPYIFRGALDCRATEINEPMKLAAARAIASLARRPVTPQVMKVTGRSGLEFGKDYIVPSPYDSRLLGVVAPAVACAARDSGVAQRPIDDYDAYANELTERVDLDIRAVSCLLDLVPGNKKAG